MNAFSESLRAYLKGDVAQIGIVMRVYVTDSGQKRMEVRFPYSTVDAAVSEFELV